MPTPILKRLCLACLTATLAVVALPLRPCTAFCFQQKDQWYFGRNMDWPLAHGFLTVNKRNIKKTTLLALNPTGASSKPMEWTSRFGSLTFNQYGRELPIGGMNEKGLVIECLWLNETRYPQADERPALNCLQWIQHALDTCETVEEVLVLDTRLRILHGDPTLHFLVCDPKGGHASIEFLNGKMVAHSGQHQPARALANHAYAMSLDAFKAYEKTGNLPAHESLARFTKAAEQLKNGQQKPGSDALQHVFATLDKVKRPDTILRVAYDLKSKRVHFKAKVNMKVRSVDLSRLDFSAESPVMILDFQTGKAGDVTSLFVPYTRGANLALLKKAVADSPKGAGISHLKEPHLEAVSAHMEGIQQTN